jgi:hypothetical protein
MRAEYAAHRSSVTSQIFSLVLVRKNKRYIEQLRLETSAEKQLAFSAFDYRLANRGTGASIFNQTGWKNCIEDLAFRRALNPYIAEYVGKLDDQEKALIKEIKAEAKAAKIDLKKLISQLEKDRGVRGGESLNHDSSLYDGLT